MTCSSMSIVALVDVCAHMSDTCKKMEDTTASALAELAGMIETLRVKDVEISELRVDNVAMRGWGERVEARRLGASKREEAMRSELSSRIHCLSEENLGLARRISDFEAEAVRANEEMSRLREEALETCSVSRSVMLQNSHTRMERELFALRAHQEKSVLLHGHGHLFH